MRAIVAGMIASYPVGGVAWDYGQYLLGLERLGFEVYYLEDTGWLTYDPTSHGYSEEPTYAVDFLARSLAMLSPSLAGRWHFRAMDGRTFGIDRARFLELVEGADVLLNVSGGTLLREEYRRCRRTIFLDTDPGWNHFFTFPRCDRETWRGELGYRAHDRFFTYAERTGRDDCRLPGYGLAWEPTRPPVVLARWVPQPPGDTWTTVMTWDNFRKPIEHEGVEYGSKEREFMRFESLPSRVPASLEMAVGGDHAPREQWRELGWSVRDSHLVSATMEQYRDYIERSRGEFSVAKNIYVDTRSGWFSCRSVCYLAAERPVVVQDTGFSELIPTGDGLFAVSTLDEAVAALEAVEADYGHHQRAARQIAREHFDSDRVLAALLERAGVP